MFSCSLPTALLAEFQTTLYKRDFLSPPPPTHPRDGEYETECTERQDDRRGSRVPSKKRKAKVILSLATSQRSASVPFTQLQSCVGRSCGLTVIRYNITLLPSVNTLIARGMFCGARYTHYTFTPIIKHLITTTANKHPGQNGFAYVWMYGCVGNEKI